METLGVESFTASAAEPRMVQFSGGGASAITEAFHPYGGTLTQPAIAKATRHNRESLPLRRWATMAKAVLTTLI